MIETMKQAQQMAGVVRLKWPGAEAVRLLDQAEVLNAPPGHKMTVQVLDYTDGEWKEFKSNLLGLGAAYSLARKIDPDGPVRLAIAARP